MACKRLKVLLGSVAAVTIGVVASMGGADAQSPAAGSTGAPQSAVPAPLPPEAKPDTPGGAARDGVIVPPAPTADTAINRGAPAGTLSTPVIPPPGSPGGNPAVVPK